MDDINAEDLAELITDTVAEALFDPERDASDVIATITHDEGNTVEVELTNGQVFVITVELAR